MSEEKTPQEEIDQTQREADRDLGRMEDRAREMSERLDDHESGEEEVEIPEPDKGDRLNITNSDD